MISSIGCASDVLGIDYAMGTSAKLGGKTSIGTRAGERIGEDGIFSCGDGGGRIVACEGSVHALIETSPST